MDLEAVRTFVAVSDAGQFSEAAGVPAARPRSPPGRGAGRRRGPAGRRALRDNGTWVPAWARD
ncbi:MAG: hypothetical protein ACRDOA_17475 [Streptosporangiaceae bacterium]